MSIDNYSTQFKIKIGEMVLKKQRIYLDTKYWIFMREALQGNASDTQTKIYVRLKDLVKKEVVICPLSPHVFQELMNIGDREKRLRMAEVMDELSQQVCFISPPSIVGQELLSFVRNCQAKSAEKSLFNLSKYVFTKIAFVLGEIYPSIKGIPDERMDDMQVQFFDYLSRFTLAGMLKTMNCEDFPLWNRENLIDSLNQGKDNNQNWKSFYDVFMHEIAGILDVVRDDLEKLWVYLYMTDKGEAVTLEEVRKSESVKLLSNMIYNAFAKKKINKELPYFHITASLHAYPRYNTSHRYKENDLIDFSHAAWALPYCNMFLTEKPLHDWICNKPLKLNEVYGSKVLWNEEDVLNNLESIEK